MIRELDAACARAMGWDAGDPGDEDYGWHVDQGMRLYEPYPNYSTDPTAARLLEDEIERRGLQRRYMHHLGVMETSAAYVDDREQYGWELLRATPEQRARAFLAALDNAPRS